MQNTYNATNNINVSGFRRQRLGSTVLILMLASLASACLALACRSKPDVREGIAANPPLPLEGATNLRELGGYPAADGARIRSGIVYRSGALDRLTDSDLKLIAALNLQTVVDFRMDEEVAAATDRLPEHQAIRQVRLPIAPADPTGFVQRLLAGQIKTADESTRYMESLYASLPLDHAEQYKSFFDELLRSGDSPLLFHCTAGKDRAGLASAFLLRLLGVPMGVIETDYLASPPPPIASDLLPKDLDLSLLEPVLDVRLDYLQAAFNAIDQVHGSFDQYAESALGMDLDRRRKLAQMLLTRSD